MPRIIKFNQVAISDEAQLIDVPSKNFFNPNINPSMRHDNDFIPADFAEGEEDDAEDFVDPELVVKMAEEQAAGIIEAANNEADLIIQKAKLIAEEEKAAAREEGMAEGFAEGTERARLENEQLLAEAAQIIEDAKAEREAILASIEPETVSLVIDITEKLVGSALRLNPQAILHIIQAGVESVLEADELCVRVSKDDYETANSLKDEIISLVDSDTAVTIVKDASLTQGDCVIDTPIGSIDSSLSKQWETLKTDLYLLLRE